MSDDPAPKYWPGYDAIAQTEDACRFIERRSAAGPFLLVLSLGPPHFPYATAPERYREMYAGRELRLRRNVPDGQRTQAAEILRGYYAHMSALDDCFGRLLRTLDRAGAAEDTIVVFTSDHGDMMLSQGLTTKLYPWDESIRVPFLLRYPRTFGRKRRRIQTPLNSPDIMPTLLGAMRAGDSGFGGGQRPFRSDHGTLTRARRDGGLPQSCRCPSRKLAAMASPSTEACGPHVIPT